MWGHSITQKEHSTPQKGNTKHKSRNKQLLHTPVPSLALSLCTSPLGLLSPTKLLPLPPSLFRGVAERRLGRSLDHLLLAPSSPPSQGLCFVMGNLL